MNKTLIIFVAVAAAAIGVVALTLMLLSESQDTRSRASQEQPLSIPSPTSPASAQSAQSCPAPGAVPDVLVEYPNCIGEICNFDKASCTWGSVAGATKYKMTVTETDTETIIRDEEVEASITRVEFDINQGMTYKCDISAINSCGAVGAVVSHSLLCETDVVAAQPTPTPTIISRSACGFTCVNTSDCDSGLTCVTATNGQGYCAIPSYQATCANSPSVSACCSAPVITVTETPSPTLLLEKPTITSTPVPTIPPSGVFDNTITMGVGIVALLIIGGALFML